MEHRPLGRTGVSVSKLCLGAMMFGAWGNPDHDESIRIIHAALDAGINFIDTADVYSPGESEEIVGKALQGPARRRRARDQVPRADGRATRTSAATRGAGSSQEVENSLRRLRHRLDRPLPGPPARPGDRHRGDARRARPTSSTRARSATSAPRRSRPSQIVEAQWVARERRPAALRAASSRRTRSSCAGSRPTCCRPASSYGMGVIPWSPLAGGWLSGRYRKGADVDGRRRPRAERLADRYDLVAAGEPAQARRRRRSSRSSPTRPGSR